MGGLSPAQDPDSPRPLGTRCPSRPYGGHPRAPPSRNSALRPGRRLLNPRSRDCTPQEGKWGAKLGHGSQERAAPPRAVSSPCRAPPGAARLACGGRDSQVEARRPARPAAARACPVLRPPQGPPDNQSRAALRDRWALEEGWAAEQGRGHTPPHPPGWTPSSIPTMSSLVMDWCLSELKRAPQGIGVAFAYIVHFRA